MRRCTVVALPEVLHCEFPVSRRGILLPRGDLHGIQTVPSDIGLEIPRQGFEFDDFRIIFLGEADEYEALIDGGSAGMKRPVFRSEPVWHESCPDEPALEVPGPGVVGTGECVPLVPILQHDPAASVAADVEEGPNFPILASDEDDRLSCDLPGDDVAGFRDGRDMVD